MGILLVSSVFLLIPLLIALYLGVRFLFNRSIFSRKVIFIGAVAWLALGIALIFFGLRTATFFQQEGKAISTMEFGKSPRLLQVSFAEEDKENRFQPASISILASKDTALRVQQEIVSRGSDREEAEGWAAMARYQISKPNDSSLLVGNSLQFLPGARFRAQEGKVKVLVPVGTLVRIDRETMWQFPWDDAVYRTLHRTEQQDAYDFVVTADSLRCLNCQPIVPDSLQQM
jgi:hypothetical protein